MDLGDLYDRDLILTAFKQEREMWKYRNEKSVMLPTYEINELLVEALPKEYRPKEEAIALSSALHLLHSLDSEVRGIA